MPGSLGWDLGRDKSVRIGSKKVEALEHQLVEFLMNLFQTIGWLDVVVIMALESANIPIPSEVTMPLAGWMLVRLASLERDWSVFGPCCS